MDPTPASLSVYLLVCSILIKILKGNRLCGRQNCIQCCGSGFFGYGGGFSSPNDSWWWFVLEQTFCATICPVIYRERGKKSVFFLSRNLSCMHYKVAYRAEFRFWKQLDPDSIWTSILIFKIPSKSNFFPIYWTKLWKSTYILKHDL